MTPTEERVFNETRLRNLRRSYSKLIMHGDLADEALQIKKEIETIKNQLAMT